MNTIKVVDFELVKELRKIDARLVIFEIGMLVLIHDYLVVTRRVKKLEEELNKKEKSKED